MTKELRWKVEEYDNNISKRLIRVVGEDGEVICDNEPYYPHAINPKHAHLIAASPDMLEVLHDAAINNMVVEDTDWWKRVYAAIAKAEGRSP